MSELFITGSVIRTRTNILCLKSFGVVADSHGGPYLSQYRMDPLTQFPSPFMTEDKEMFWGIWGYLGWTGFHFHTVPVSPKVAFPLVEPEGFIRMPCSWTLSGVIDWKRGWKY